MSSIWIFVLVCVVVTRSADACTLPPTICTINYPHGTDLVPFEVVDTYLHQDYEGRWCVCPDGQDYDVCFPAGSSFDGETKAELKSTDGGCETYCAVNTDGQEVCANKCEIPDYLRVHYTEISQLGFNVICNQTTTDSCCPEKGTLCHYSNQECEKPRCTDIETTGCLFCFCNDPEPPTLCTDVPPTCTFHNNYYCCAQSDYDFECEHVNPETTLNGFLRHCGADPSFVTCPGVVTSDENCCPQGCLDPGRDCNCDGFNQDTIIDWFVDIQKDNREKPNNVVKQFGWVRVGGAKRVFVRRKDRQPFCLSTISMSTFCIGHVAAKINFVDGSSTTVEMNVDDEQSDVSLGPFDPIYMDVKSVRIGFTKGGGTCFNGYVRNMKFTTCNEP